MTDALRAETVRITGHQGDEIEAYLAQPLSDGPFGAVVVIHHMPGYDEETKEITRKFAPYIGVTYEQKFGSTARFVRAVGEASSDVRFTTGLRAWF